MVSVASDVFMVKPLANGTLGVLCLFTIFLPTAIGVVIAVGRCEPRESQWLFQHIYFDIVQSNNVSTFAASTMRNKLPYYYLSSCL